MGCGIPAQGEILSTLILRGRLISVLDASVACTSTHLSNNAQELTPCGLVFAQSLPAGGRSAGTCSYLEFGWGVGSTPNPEAPKKDKES
jgi:hypothetical protein